MDLLNIANRAQIHVFYKKDIYSGNFYLTNGLQQK